MKIPQPINIVLIEDNPGDRDLVLEILADAAPLASVRSADSLQQGLGLIQEELPNIVLTDLGLPDADECEAIKVLAHRFPGLPIIAITGRDDPETLLDIIATGAQDYIPKGVIDPPLYARSIRYAIERCEARNRLARLNRTLQVQKKLNKLMMMTKSIEELCTKACHAFVDGGAFEAAWMIGKSPQGGWEIGYVGEKMNSDVLEIIKADPSVLKCWGVNEHSEEWGCNNVSKENCHECPLWAISGSDNVYYNQMTQGDQVIGMIALMTSNQLLDEEEQSLLREISQDLKFGILNHLERFQHKRTQDAYAQLVNNLNSGVVIYKTLDHGKNFIVWDINPSAKKILKMEAADVIGMTLEECFPNTVDNGFVEVIHQIFTTQESMLINEVRYQSENLDLYVDYVIYPIDPVLIGVTFNDVTERVSSRQKIIQDEAKYRSLAETSRAIYWKYDLNEKRWVYVSPQVESILGYLPESFYTGLTWEELVHPDDLLQVNQSNWEDYEDNPNYELEYRLRKSDGNYIWVKDSVEIEFQHGKPSILRAMCIDITRTKSAELQAVESADFANSVLNSLGAMIAIVNETGEIIDVNETWSTSGKERGLDDPIAWNYLEVCDVAAKSGIDDARQFAEGIRGVIAGTIQAYTLEYPCHDGIVSKWYKGSVTPFFHSNHQVVIAHEDITARKLAEEQLERNEEFLEETARMAKIGGWEYNATTGKVTWTNGTREIHEAPSDYEPTLELAVDFYEEADKERIRQAISNSIEVGEPYKIYARIKTWKGNKLHVALTISPTIIDGKIEVLRGVIQDITDEVQKREEIERQARVISQIQDIVLIKDMNGVVEFVNDAFCQTFECSRGEVIGKKVSDKFCPPTCENKSAKEECIEDEISRRGMWQGELECETKAGNTIFVLASFYLIYDDNGQPVNVFGFGVNITEKKKAEQALAQSEERVRMLANAVDQSPNGIMILDKSGRIEYVNQVFSKRIGLKPNELIGREPNEFKRDEMSGDFYNEVLETVINGTDWRGEIYNRKSDGTPLWERVNISPIFNEHGELEKLLSIEEDITKEKQSEEELRSSEERYELAAKAANDVLWDYNLNEGSLYVSPRLAEISGNPSLHSNVRLDSIRKLIHVEDLEKCELEFSKALETGRERIDTAFRLKNNEGLYRWVLIRGLIVRNENGMLQRIVGSASDITEQKVAEEQLIYGAFHDPLTGIANRELFRDRVKQAASFYRRSEKGTFAVMILDLDRFKNINDTMGHPAGDELIKIIATRIKECVRPSDTVARLGGDEFAILLEPLPDMNLVKVIAERILREIRKPVLLQKHHISISASIGVVFASAEEYDIDTIISNADIALYKAKAAGRATYEFFNSDMYSSSKERLRMEMDLLHAVERNELVLHLQPVVDLEKGRIQSFEALIRWQHPTRGLVSPGVFIPIAEEIGVISQISDWVAREACEIIDQWKKNSVRSEYPSIAINASAKDLVATIAENRLSQDPEAKKSQDLFDRIDGLAEARQIPRNVIGIEVTEGVLIDNPKQAALVLNRFAEAGYSLKLDDFGTGFSSLSYLHDLPFDTVKLDRSFVVRLDASEKSRFMLEGIVELAKRLNLTIIAEGIETTTELNALRKLGVDYGQGYLFSRPVPVEKAFALWEADHGEKFLNGASPL